MKDIIPTPHTLTWVDSSGTPWHYQASPSQLCNTTLGSETRSPIDKGGLALRLSENGSSSNPHTRPSNIKGSFYFRIETCLSPSPLINDKIIILHRLGRQECGWWLTFLFGGFLPDQSIRRPLPRAAIRGKTPHPTESGREGLKDTKGTCPQGLTDASSWGVWGNSGPTSILSAPPASSSAILRETEPRSCRPPAGDKRKPVAGPRDEGRHFYDGPWSRVCRRLEQRLPVCFPEASVMARRVLLP